MDRSSQDKGLIQSAEEVKLSAEAPPLDQSELINASGHVQELDRNYSLLSLAGQGIVVGNVWPVLGGSIAISIFNGGAPGAIFEFIAAAIFYWIVAASLAELASAVPSAGGVYHWASITPGRKWGRPIGFYAGWWNWIAYCSGSASQCAIVGNICVQLYAINHPGFEPKQWHVFVGYVLMCWLSTFVLCTANCLLPYMNTVGLFFLLTGFFVTIITVAVMPSGGGRPGHASSDFVWREWQADIGYPNGFVFLLGMLNGAYAVGTPDCLTHLAEEIPHPKRNLPKAIGLQQATGFLTGLAYLIAILYSINDYSKLGETAFPLAEIYHQATGSAAGTTGLLIVSFFPQFLCTIAGFISNGRAFWALARDEATPFPSFLSRVDPELRMPFRAQITVGVVTTLLGCIYVGSTTAFNAFVGSFILNSTASYVAAILPHVLTRRRNIVPGPFFMKGAVGDTVNVISIVYMIVFDVIYCFPAALPVNAKSMNYTCLIFGGLTIFISAWWFIGPRNGLYEGPRASGGQESQAEAVKKVDRLTR